MNKTVETLFYWNIVTAQLQLVNKRTSKTQTRYLATWANLFGKEAGIYKETLRTHKGT